MIAGSMYSMGPLDESQSTPRGEAAEMGYRKQTETLAEAGVDVVVIKRLRDIANASLVVEAATAVGLPVVVVVVGWSASLDEEAVVPHRSGPYRDHQQRSFDELMRLGTVHSAHRPGGRIRGRLWAVGNRRLAS